jgi:hypothetical protein
VGEEERRRQHPRQGQHLRWTDAFDVFVAALNTASFAGHNDWRLPNRFELETLVDLGAFNPATARCSTTTAASRASGNPGCTVTTCNCTPPVAYWTSTTMPTVPPQLGYAWNVYFFLGNNGYDYKYNPNYVRAVRGGS